MAELTITREDSPEAGRYVGRIDGVEGEAELTYTRPGPRLVSANHTGVPDSMAGQGVAKALLDRLLRDARQDGFRIIPVCPFIAKQYQKHPEWADLFAATPKQES